MSGTNNTNNNNKEEKDSTAHEQRWDDVALTPCKATFEPHRAEGVIIGQGAGWTNFDLEAKAPPKKHSWFHGRKSKIVIGVAIVAMVVVGITVPMVVGIRMREAKGYRSRVGLTGSGK